MTVPRAAPRRPDDAAISSVLGAVLVFGLLVITLVVVQTEFVPVWAEEREASHMQELTTQLGQMKSDLDRQVDNRTSVSISNPLTLQREGGFRFFSGVQVPAEVSFEASAAGSGVTLRSDSMTILQSGDQSFLGLADDDDWVDIPPTDEIEDITLVRALRLRIDMNEDVCVNYDANDYATLIIKDSDDEEAGRATVTWVPSNSAEWGLRLDIFANFDDGATANDQISSDTEFFFQQLCAGTQENYLDYHYFDLLDPSYLFDAVLEAAGTPITLELEELGLVASYVMVYDAEPAGGGTTTFGSLGLVVAPYEPDPFAAGRLVIDTNNQNYVEQTYILEHGALLRMQGGDAAMAIPPNFRVTQSDTQTTIDWALPSLDGSSGSLSGSDTATVVGTPDGDRIDIQATTAALTLEIPSEYPAVWEEFFDRELRAAGMDASTQYDLSSDADSVILEITGASSLVTVEDIFIQFRQTNIDLDLRSSG